MARIPRRTRRASRSRHAGGFVPPALLKSGSFSYGNNDSETEGIAYAIGYARVSLAKQAVQGEGLEMQTARIARFIEFNGWVVFPSDEGILQEPFTGTTDDRPVYQRALKIIRENPGNVRYFVIATLDRISREGSFEYKRMKRELAALGVELRDASGVIQPAVNSLAHRGFAYSWSITSPSDIGEVAIAEANAHERSKILSRLVDAQIEITQLGYHLGLPNDGYSVKRIWVNGKKRFAQFPDPERAHFFRRMYVMRDEGTHSDQQIAAQVNALGYLTRVRQRWNREKTTVLAQTEPKPLTVKRLQELIQNPAYCGIVVRKWTHWKPIRAMGEPLVSIDLFNRANRGTVFVEEKADGSLDVLYDYHPVRVVRKREKYSLKWKYKNVIVCSICRKPLWASASRGRSGQYFASYHCTRNHPRQSYPQQRLDQAFDAFLDRVRFGPLVFEEFRSLLTHVYREAAGRWADDRHTRSNRIAELEARAAHLALAFADTTLPSIRRRLEAEVASIESQIAEAKADAKDFGVTNDGLTHFINGHWPRYRAGPKAGRRRVSDNSPETTGGTRRRYR